MMEDCGCAPTFSRFCDEPAECDGIEFCRLHTAAKDLLKAAKLTALHFKRMQASGNFFGDDEHEAWSALENAIAKVEGK